MEVHLGPQAWGMLPLPAGQQSGPRLWIALEMPHLTTSYPVSASHCCWSVYHQDHMGRELVCPQRAHRGPDHPEATLREHMAQDSHSPTPFHCGTVLFSFNVSHKTDPKAPSGSPKSCS